MAECRESFADIVAVWPFLAGEIKYKVPFNVRSRKVSVNEIGVSSLDTLLKNRGYYSVGENYEDSKCVEIEERKCILKSASKRTISGRSYDVSLVLIINEKSDNSATMMDEIEMDRHDFIVQCADSSYLLVRSVEMGYKCVAEEEISENYQQKLTITMTNYNGIQRIY